MDVCPGQAVTPEVGAEGANGQVGAEGAWLGGEEDALRTAQQGLPTCPPQGAEPQGWGQLCKKRFSGELPEISRHLLVRTPIQRRRHTYSGQD